eukprot:14274882-Alexandrium_andersonii.AAC.1
MRRSGEGPRVVSSGQSSPLSTQPAQPGRRVGVPRAGRHPLLERPPGRLRHPEDGLPSGQRG